MVIGDINIICVHQKIEVINRFTTAQVDPYLLTGNPEDFYYYWCRDYKLGTQEGMMYVIYPEGRFEDNYDKEYMDLQFESYDWNVDCPPEIVFIDDEFTEQLIQVLHDCVFISQSEEVYFFADLQGYEEKLVDIRWEEFLNIIKNDNLIFNTVYRILK